MAGDIGASDGMWSRQDGASSDYPLVPQERWRRGTPQVCSSGDSLINNTRDYLACVVGLVPPASLRPARHHTSALPFCIGIYYTLGGV